MTSAHLNAASELAQHPAANTGVTDSGTVSWRSAPMLDGQQAIWLADQLGEEDHVYAISHCVELRGQLNADYLQQAIRMGIAEADTVCARYPLSSATNPQTTAGIAPMQLASGLNWQDVEAPRWLDATELAGATSSMNAAELRQLAFDWMWQQSREPYSVSSPQPLQQQQVIIRLSNTDESQPDSPQHWLWFQKFHHLMLDGFSFTALTRRISDIYQQLWHQQPVSASPFTAVADVSNEYQQYRHSEAWQQDKQFWFDNCATASPVYTLSRQGPANDLPTARIVSHQQWLDAETLSQLHQLSQQLGNELKASQKPALSDWIMAWLTAYLARYTGLNRHRVGVPFMRRMGSAAIRSTAPVVNVLPVQLDLEEHTDWLELACHIKQQLKTVRRHQRYDAEQIQRDQQHLNDQSGKLYGPLLNYKLFDFQLQLPAAEAETHHLATGPIDDFEFGILVHDDRILLELRAEQGRYQPEELQQHGERLQQLLQHWLEHPKTAVQQLPLLTATEHQQLQQWSNGLQVEPEAGQQTILATLFASLQAQPAQTALICGEQQLSNEQVQQRIQQLSHWLIQQQCGPGTIVAVAIPRSVDALLAMLAVMNSGATFMPVDLDYPAERIAMMCEDAAPSLLLSRSDAEADFPSSLPRLNIDQQQAEIEAMPNGPVTDQHRLSPLCRQHIAYVIFTSGSTGRPKGVMNSHGALLNLLTSHRQSIYSPALEQQQQNHPGRPLMAAHTHSFSFDSSWLQVFWLVLGQTLVIFDEQQRRDAHGLAESIRQLPIDALDLPPSFCSQLLNALELQNQQAESAHWPTLILIGGEAAPAALWQQLRQLHQQYGLQSHNLYGPTEYTVDTLRAAIAEHPEPVIGRPIGNTRALVLDGRLRQLPAGVIGELYLSGRGLANGYLGRADLTAARFVANPFISASSANAERMYRTGDLVRWSEQGQLEYLGRSDDQIKIRGYRVELGEVENALSLLDGVESTVVITETINNSHRLLAYCVAADPQALQQQGAQSLAQQWLSQLHQQLPDYMVPSILMVLDDFPRNVSGKIDRKALPTPQQWLANQPQALTNDALSPLETVLIKHCTDVLQLPQAQPEDDFFMLGGDSISAIMLCAALRSSGYQLRPASIFTLRKLASIAAAITPSTDISANTDISASNNISANRTIEFSDGDLQLLQREYGESLFVSALLPLQQGMLFETLFGQDLQQTEEDQPQANYNAFTRLHFHGPLDAWRLQQSLDQLLQQYPQLNGLFDTHSLSDSVFVYPPATRADHWPMAILDLSPLPASQRLQQQQQAEQQMLQQPMNSASFGGLIRAQLFKHDDQQWQLLLVIHHLVTDGWSSPLILNSLCQNYHQLTSGSKLQKPADPGSYANVVNQLAARDPGPARQHWQQQLANIQPCRLFEEADSTALVEELQLTLAPQQHRQLQQQLQARGLTLNALMQGLWALALHGLSGRNEVVFGTPVSGRQADVAGLQQQVGLFLNTLPVRVNLDVQTSLWQQLADIQQQHLTNLDFDTIGLAEIQQLAAASQLFDSLLVVENYPDNRYLSEPLSAAADGRPALTIIQVDNRGYSHYPLALLVIPEDGLSLLLENRGALTSAQAQALLQRLEFWLQQLLQQPDTPICRWPMLSNGEQHQIDQINQTLWPLPKTSLRSLLHQQARRSPQAMALQDDQHQLNFAELRLQVSALASQLRQQGIGPGDIVAVALPRSACLSIAILAVIESGAAYLPMELDYPDERLAIMLEDSAARLLISHSSQQARFEQIQAGSQLAIPLQLLDHLPLQPGQALADSPENELAIRRQQLQTLMDSLSDDQLGLQPDHPAYLIFTSGTTGRPKGVLVSHQAIVNRILWMQHQYPLGPDDAILQKTPCSFDVSVWEFFWSYLTGARLVMAAPDVHKDPQALADTIERFGVTTLHFVPSMLALFTASHQHNTSNANVRCSSLKQVFCSGEALTKTQARNFRSVFNAELHNLYGPTEAAVDVSWQPAFAEGLDAGGAGVAIGKPVWNTCLYILDQYLRPVAPGCAGELYLAGIQLAHGYLGRPDLTASRFVADPFGEPGSRTYRTGDLARWLDSGEVEYLGRADDQIKIRGQRVELGEIESQLRQQPEVANAVVQAVELGQHDDSMDSRQLVCWLVARAGANSSTNPAELANRIRQRLSTTLPAHMVPVAVVWMDELPLSPNGKLDRKALPLPATESTARQSGRAPVAGLESRLARLFERLLGRAVMAEDDFFAIGGHSLLAMQLAALVRKELKRDISVGQIILNPTVASLAEQLNSDVMLNDFGQQGFGEVLPLRKGLTQGQQLLCFCPGSGFAWQYSVLSRYLDPNWSITGLQSPRPDGLIARSADMQELINRQLQIIRSIQPQGPYYLLGYSLGGTIAWHLARRLEDLGEQVAFLGLLDTYPTEVHDWNDPEGAEASAGAEREQQQLLTDAMNAGDETAESENQAIQQERDAMLQQIFANYQDAVRLLAKTRTPTYKGNAELFVANRDLPDYIDPGNDWLSYIRAPQSLQLHLLDSSHEDILSPASLQVLGPLLNSRLNESLNQSLNTENKQ
ncbi:non-ribosomal peptide synthetase [Oceanobacter mangrovi]|uniref:non-ribosomal peptide synthetase n=1 Tax=Oceanobacter mangrovi TaxID=2862510 RepID=UPI001C8E1786|nr:non-ribosomal peptide synthetase [Oceanobacter mangrovi]